MFRTGVLACSNPRVVWLTLRWAIIGSAGSHDLSGRLQPDGTWILYRRLKLFLPFEIEEGLLTSYSRDLVLGEDVDLKTFHNNFHCNRIQLELSRVC